MNIEKEETTYTNDLKKLKILISVTDKSDVSFYALKDNQKLKGVPVNSGEYAGPIFLLDTNDIISLADCEEVDKLSDSAGELIGKSREKRLQDLTTGAKIFYHINKYNDIVLEGFDADILLKMNCAYRSDYGTACEIVNQKIILKKEFYDKDASGNITPKLFTEIEKIYDFKHAKELKENIDAALKWKYEDGANEFDGCSDLYTKYFTK